MSTYEILSPSQERKQGGKQRIYHTNDTTSGAPECVYCGEKGHKGIDCGNVTTTDERRTILSNKRLCFNCCGKQHQAKNCRSKQNCHLCKGRHHTSICDGGAQAKAPGSSLQPMRMIPEEQQEQSPIYPTVVVKVMGVQCRAVLDTLAWSSCFFWSD